MRQFTKIALVLSGITMACTSPSTTVESGPDSVADEAEDHQASDEEPSPDLTESAYLSYEFADRDTFEEVIVIDACRMTGPSATLTLVKVDADQVVGDEFSCTDPDRPVIHDHDVLSVEVVTPIVGSLGASNEIVHGLVDVEIYPAEPGDHFLVAVREYEGAWPVFEYLRVGLHNDEATAEESSLGAEPVDLPHKLAELKRVAKAAATSDCDNRQSYLGMSDDMFDDYMALATCVEDSDGLEGSPRDAGSDEADAGVMVDDPL